MQRTDFNLILIIVLDYYYPSDDFNFDLSRLVQASYCNHFATLLYANSQIN
jgi:hypothetical protein